jgi:D-alanyl-D-alanine dipeptidase
VVSPYALALLAVTTVACVERPPPAYPVPPMGIERWAALHPVAARELGDWVRVHPQAAARLFQWDAHHPERARLFVLWAVENPQANVDGFVLTHPNWPLFDQLMEQYRPAAEAFLLWTRRHPQAASALMLHARGLAWAGQHLYADYWLYRDPG